MVVCLLGAFGLFKEIAMGIQTILFDQLFIYALLRKQADKVQNDNVSAVMKIYLIGL